MAKVPKTETEKEAEGTPSEPDSNGGGLAGEIGRGSRLPQRADAVFWAALVVGLILVGVGLWLWSVQRTPAMLTLSAGLGIVLATLGAMAVVQYKLPIFGGMNTVVGGSAALTVGLFALTYYSLDHPAQQFSDINLTNLPLGSRLTIGARQLFHTKQSARIAGSDQYDVLVPVGLLSKSDLISGNIEYKMKDDMCAQERAKPGNLLAPCTREIDFKCISPAPVKAALDQGVHELRWSLDQGTQYIIDEEGQRLDGQDCEHSRPADTSPVFGFIDTLIGSAWASPDMSVGELLKLLESDSTTQRRLSRDQLSNLGLDAIPAMMQALAPPDASYRTRLGVCVALTEYLRDHKEERKKISALLSEEDIGLLLDAASDPDRTIRIYASEFLYDLGDPRSVLPGLEQVLKTDNDNGKYNLLLVVKGSIADLSSDFQRAKAQALLDAIRPQVGDKTKVLVDQIAAIGTAQAVTRYWVIVGSFRDEKNAQAFADTISKQAPDLPKPFVGKTSPDNPFYPVIVGDYVPRQEAEKIRQQALNSKLITDAYLSDYPDRR